MGIASIERRDIAGALVQLPPTFRFAMGAVVLLRRPLNYIRTLALAAAAAGIWPAQVVSAPAVSISPKCQGSTAGDADWANLAHYRRANCNAPEPVAVFMGDSITEYWAAPPLGGFFARNNYLGRGISGQTTPQMLIRFRQDVIALRPKVVVVLAGTNDIAGNTGPASNEEIEGNLASMSELAAAAEIRVVLASITPVSFQQSSAPSGRRPMARVRAINTWMRKYAEDNKLVYLDYFSAMVDSQGFLKTEFSDDGLHPNAKGYALMEPLAEAAMATALH